MAIVMPVVAVYQMINQDRTFLDVTANCLNSLEMEYLRSLNHTGVDLIMFLLVILRFGLLTLKKPHLRGN